jgi:hypothetical protein
MQTGDSRVLSDTKDMLILWWAADATQFYADKLVNEQTPAYGLSLAGGTPLYLVALSLRPPGDTQ